MSQLDSGPTTYRTKPSNNVYSVLVFIAFAALAVAVSVVWMQNLKLTEGEPGGGTNPFVLVQ